MDSNGTFRGTAITSSVSSPLSFPTSRQPDDLASYLSTASALDAEVDFYRVDEKLWALALDRLIARAMLEEAVLAGQRLAAAYPASRFFATMAGILARLPPACNDTAFAAFCDDPRLEVQVIPRDQADVVLLGFCGRAERMGMPLNLIHRWFGLLNAHVIYLRDYSRNHYDNGIDSLGPGLAGTLSALRELINALGPDRIVCYGNSMGGYGALRYGLELQAEAVLGFAAMTILEANEGEQLFQQRRLAPGIDLRPLYQRAATTPRVHLVYSEHYLKDRIQALNFEGLPNVTIEAARCEVSRQAVLHALFGGRFEPLIRWLVDANRGAGMP